jgi:hypothetical protein
MKKTDAKNRQERWAQGENTMRFRKEIIEWKNDSTNLSRKEQMVVSRLRTGYTRATHRHVIEKTPSPECPFCGMSLTTEHILWECKETTRERRETGTTKEVWTDGRSEKTYRIYKENRIIPWNMNKVYVWKIKN